MCGKTPRIIPRGPGAHELAWTFFGYKDDDAAMVARRVRQANLMGPSGFVSVDDSEVMKYVQEGVAHAPGSAGVVEMGDKGWREEESHVVTESEIRAMYQYYRSVMDL